MSDLGPANEPKPISDGSLRVDEEKEVSNKIISNNNN